MDIDVRITQTPVVELTDVDLSELQDLRTRSADYFSEHGDPPPTLESLEVEFHEFPDGVTKEDLFVYRLYRGSELDAFALVVRGFSVVDEWLIGTAMVDSAKRSCGIGHLLVEQIASDALGEGMNSLIAGVFATRDRAKAFWVREGFVNEVGRRPVESGDLRTEVIRLKRELRQQR